jgi:signal transduction histidine kinase
MPVVVRVAISSAFTVALVALALTITIWSFRGAVDAHHAALADVEHSQTGDRAETYVLRERGAINEYLLTRDPDILEELDTLSIRFDEVVSRFGAPDDPHQAALGARTRDANDALLATFRSSLGASTRYAGRPAELRRNLISTEKSVLAPLRTLEALHDAGARRSDAHADARSHQALIAGLAAGALAIVGGLLFALYAITLLRRVARQNDALLQVDRMKDDFVSTVSHELRTPLTSINGYLEVLLDGGAGTVSAEQAGFLGVMRKNSDRLLQLVGDLLFVGNVSVDVTIERVPVELSSLVRRAVEDKRQPFADRDLELTFAGTELVEIEGDPSRLTQLVDSLLSNALKFTPPGGRVEVCLTSRDDSARLQVSDTGMGISEADRKHVFERFYRSADVNDRAIQGSGLGLAIVAAIVEAHGGSVEVESDLGVGTTFTVVLPAARAERSLAA